MKVTGILLLVCVTAQSATYHVATSGLDANDGSEGSPWLTVQKGLNTVAAGDRLLIGVGLYTNTVGTLASGTSVAPIIIDGQGVAALGSLIVSDTYYYIQNLTFSNSPILSQLYMERSADFCIISNNIFDAQLVNGRDPIVWLAPETGPFGDAGSHNLIVSNTLKHGLSTAMISSFGDSNVFYGNRLIDSDTVDWFRTFGRSNIVSGNICSNAYISGAGSEHPDFFQVFGNQGYGATSTVIEGNTVIGMDGESQLCMLTSSDMPDVHSFTFRNNLFIGVSAKGTMAVRDVHWYNNTFIRCSTNFFTGGPILIFTSATNETVTNFVWNSGHGGRAFNNAFLDCGYSTNLNGGWYSFATYLTNVQADYNFVAKDNYKAVDVDAMQRPVGDPGGWDPFKWWENNGVNGGNPLFVGALDFQLQSGSPLKDAGTNLTFTTDLFGVSRPQGAAWDMGPYEFVAPVLHHRGVSIQGRRRFAR